MDFAEVGLSLIKVVVVGLLLGAGLPAVFAVGLRAVSRTVPVEAGGAGGDVRRSRAGLALGYACFGFVGLAVLVGIAWIIVS